MKTAKRILSVALAVLMIFGASACNKGPDMPGVSDTTVDTQTPNTTPESLHPLDAGSDTEGIDITGIDLSRYNTLSVSDYIDSTAAAHISQYIGFLSGYEFARDSSGNILVGMPDDWFEICNGPYAEYNEKNKHVDKLIYNEKRELWEIYNDDDFSIDILNQYIISDMYKYYNTLCSRAIGDGWVNYDVYDMGGGHRSVGAYGLFKEHGYLSYFVGRSEFGNRYGVNGEPYIANETLGLNCAGMPKTASELSLMFASVTSDMDPVLWAQFFATMYSLAYFESDIPALIAQARKALPEKCVVQDVIDEVLEIRDQYPELSQWRLAAKKIESKVYRHHYGQDSKMGETSINCAFVLLGLLWGEGDWYESCRIISLAGHGGDSTTPVGLGIVGVICGLDAIPAEALAKTWQDGDGVVINKPIDETTEGTWMCALGLPERLYMKDTIKLYQKNFESILEERGGFRCEGTYYIPKESLEEIETPLYEDFDRGIPSNVVKIGNVISATQNDSYMGAHAMKLKGESDAAIPVDGLTVGAKYKLSAYVYTDTDTLARIYARADGDTGLGSYANIYGTKKYVLRELVFTATAESMKVGVSLGAGQSGSAIVDDFMLTKAEETSLTDKVSLSVGEGEKVKAKFTVTVSEKFEREVYLKIGFSNSTSFLLDGKITLNGSEYAAAPFYRTGKEADLQSADAVYIPILLTEDTNTVEFNIGNTREIYISSVSVVDIGY